MGKEEKIKDVNKKSRRDFLELVATSISFVGISFAAWPFIDSMNPSKKTLAEATIDIDLSDIAEGDSMTVKWRGKPIFIRHRTKEEIEISQNTEIASLSDPQEDRDRVKKGYEKWLVTIGICTHLGCVPIAKSGDYGGYFCPCHGSHYDLSGRIRKGPAALNLQVPPYKFISDNMIRIG